MSNDPVDTPAGPSKEDRRGLTREELYALVWTEPVQTVAKRFGMSDRGLAKLCERHAIPVPPRGYWRQKETGHPARRLPLPKLHPVHHGLAAVVLPEPHVVVQPVVKSEPVPDPPRVAAQRAFEAANPIVVGEIPDRPHPLVRSTRAGLRRLKEGTLERLQASGDSSLDLAVTAATRERGLRILQALCHGFKLRGWPVAARQGAHRTSQVEVHGVKIAFSLEDKLRQQARPKPQPIDRLFGSYVPFQHRYEYIPTGELVLKAWLYSRFKSKWTDGKRQRIEDKLNDFMITLVCIAHAETRSQEERIIYERKRSEEERQRWEWDRRQAEEKRRGEDLAQLAVRWREVELLREFVAAVRERAASSLGIAPDGQLDRWLRWANGYANRLDPLTAVNQLPPPYLSRVSWETQKPLEWPPADP